MPANPWELRADVRPLEAAAQRWTEVSALVSRRGDELVDAARRATEGWDAASAESYEQHRKQVLAHLDRFTSLADRIAGSPPGVRHAHDVVAEGARPGLDDGRGGAPRGGRGVAPPGLQARRRTRTAARSPGPGRDRRHPPPAHARARPGERPAPARPAPSSVTGAHRAARRLTGGTFGGLRRARGEESGVGTVAPPSTSVPGAAQAGVSALPPVAPVSVSVPDLTGTLRRRADVVVRRRGRRAAGRRGGASEAAAHRHAARSAGWGPGHGRACRVDVARHGERPQRSGPDADPAAGAHGVGGAAARAAREKEAVREAKRAALEEKRAERAARKAEREAAREARARAAGKDSRRDDDGRRRTSLEVDLDADGADRTTSRRRRRAASGRAGRPRADPGRSRGRAPPVGARPTRRSSCRWSGRLGDGLRLAVVDQLGSTCVAGVRSTAAVTTSATAAKPAEVRKAACRPGTNWPGTAPAAYTETMTATPTALPSCCVVCSRPDAEPACSGSTPREDGDGDRHEHQAGRQAGDQHRAEDGAEVGAVRAAPR